MQNLKPVWYLAFQCLRCELPLATGRLGINFWDYLGLRVKLMFVTRKTPAVMYADGKRVIEN